VGTARPSGRAAALFDEIAFAEDIERAGASGRTSALHARSAYQAIGCPVDELRACAALGADGTELAECVKVYLPRPAGPFGMVFHIERRDGRLVLVYLAFGVRHHPRGSNAETVYEVAHRRLHG
jgi:hypothetical protein